MACTCIGFGLYFFVHGLVFCSFMYGWLQVYAYLGRLGRRQAALWMVGYIGILVQNLHMYLNTANLKQQNIP